MDTNSIFRLKFSYKGEKNDGELGKNKLEVLAQCWSYTEAEKLAHSLIKREDMEKYENCEYEIVLTKLSVKDILLNNVLQCEEDKVMNLVELFFSGEQDGIFLIKTKFFGKEDKDTTCSYLVPGNTINDAVTYLKKYLVNRCGYATSDFIVSSSKIDNAENLYLTESIYNNNKITAIAN